MTDDSPESRAIYHPSGKLRWLKFLSGFLVTAGATMVMAWCLAWVFRKGFYLIVLAPIIAALVVAGIWYLVLTWSHCRNKAIAISASFVLGLLLYLGYFEVDLLNVVGVRHAHRLDLLPRYVQFRMKTDVLHEAHDLNPRHARRPGPNAIEQGFNWLFFGCELLAVTGLLVGTALHCTSRAYCEPCGRWMKSETLKLAPGSGTFLWDSLERGDHDGVQQFLTSTSRQSAIGCTLTVEHCPACPAEERSQSVYLTVKDVPAPGAREPLAVKVAALFKPDIPRPCERLSTTPNCSPTKSALSLQPFPASEPVSRRTPRSLPRRRGRHAKSGVHKRHRQAS